MPTLTQESKLALLELLFDGSGEVVALIRQDRVVTFSDGVQIAASNVRTAIPSTDPAAQAALGEALAAALANVQTLQAQVSELPALQAQVSELQALVTNMQQGMA